jgi:hypothetical protein
MPRALNKMTKGGGGYKRPPEIEASIDEALGQALEEQLRRANIRDPADSASAGLAPVAAPPPPSPPSRRDVLQEHFTRSFNARSRRRF